MANMSFANNAATTLASGINTSVTSLTVASGTGTLFPTLTGSQYFYCTLENSAGTSREIVKVTARSTDTFTIARGQDGTTGTAFSTGDKVELRLVRANLTDFALLDEVNTFSQQPTFSSGIKFADATTQTTAPVQLQFGGQVFTASGTFTIPTGVTAIKVTLVGAGAGGGTASYGPGGGGAQAVKYLSGLTSGATLTLTIGAGGGGAGGGYGANSPGGAGGGTTIASGTQTITTVTAGGGAGNGGAGTATNADYGGTGTGYGSSNLGMFSKGYGGANNGNYPYPGCPCSVIQYAGSPGVAGIATIEW